MVAPALLLDIRQAMGCVTDRAELCLGSAATLSLGRSARGLSWTQEDAYDWLGVGVTKGCW